MAYLPKTVVERNIRKRTRIGSDGRERTDYEAYLGVDVFTGKSVRITRGDEDVLKKAIREFYSRLQSGGDAAAALNADEAVDARHAIELITSARVGKSVTEIVKEYLSGGYHHKGVVVDTIKVEDAFREYYQSFPEGTHKKFIRKCTGKWVERNMGRVLSSFTRDEIEKYLKDSFGNLAPRTYNANLIYIKIFLRWCADETRRYVAEDPLRTAKRKPDPWEEPEYMSPRNVKMLFRALESHKKARPDMLAYAILSFFCGVRRVEIMRIAQGEKAATINLADETVRIAKGKGYQWGRRPRAFHIEPTALVWMKSFDFLAAVKQIWSGTMLDISKLAKKRHIPMFQNCGRHSFITYHVAAYGDPAKTQAIVGTSERMRAENYCGLASKADALAYFDILPDPSAKEGDRNELVHVAPGPNYKRKGSFKKVYMFDEGYGEYLKKLEEEKRPKKTPPPPPPEKELGFELEIC